MSNNKLAYLFYKQLDGTASPAQSHELNQLLADPKQEEVVKQLMEEAWETYQHKRLVFSSDESTRLLQTALDANSKQQQTYTNPTLYILRRWRWVAAALLILAISSGIYYFNNQSYKSQKSSQITLQTKESQEIPPGTSKAILTLSNGIKKELSLADNGLQLQSDALLLTTPKGGQYHAILPDGSRVWLNAASSIKFPSKFTDKERRVEITGEIYFEIAKDASKPFKVYGGDQEIEVLGTAFNVNIYNDELFQKTTLVSGSIKVSANNQTAILKPGEQSSIPITQITKIKQITVQTTNIEQDLAWKNGLFNFENQTIQQAMNQLARWYDITVQYKGNIPTNRFSGEIPRTMSLQNVLKIIALSDVDINISDRIVTISGR